MTSFIKLHFLVYYWYGFFVLSGLISFFFLNYNKRHSLVLFLY